MKCVVLYIVYIDRICHIEFMNEFMVLLNDGDVVDHHDV